MSVASDPVHANRSASSGAGRVAILLSTFEGAKYLRQQLASLAAQTHREWHLFWRDDGSTDETCAILDDFANAGQATRVARDQRRLGVLGSFMELLELAPDDYDYFAFCDQDDVWFPDKLSRAVDRLRGVLPDRPGLYCARQTLVNRDLVPIGASPAPRRAMGFRNALVQNIVTGCTIVMNAAARRVVWDAPRPPAGTFHDWWCYICISGAGGELLFDPAPALYYRQHAANVVGATGMLERAKRAVARGAGPFLQQLGEHLTALADDRSLTSENTATVGLLDALSHNSAWERWRVLRAAKLYRQTALEDVLMYLWIGLGPVPR